MKRNDEKKKIRIEIAVIALLVVAFAVTVVINTLTNKASVTLTTEQAQTVVDETLSRIAAPTAITATTLIEGAEVTVTKVTAGTEKNFILHCTYQVKDIASVYKQNKEEIFTSAYAFMIREKADGHMVNATKIRLEMDSLLLEMLSSVSPQQGEVDLTVYEIKESVAEGDVMAVAFEDSYLRVFLDNETVDKMFGGLVTVSEDIHATEQVTYQGETVDISTNNTLRTGLDDCFALRNFSSDKPDTSAFFVAKWNSLCDEFRRNFIQKDQWTYLTNGLLTTLEITLLAAVFGVLIGFLCAVIRVTHDKTGKLMVGNQLVSLYLTIIRGTPVMVQLLIIYFVILLPVGIEKFPAAVVCFSINSGAYVAEIVRGGIMSVDEGQVEAGRSLGFNYASTMWHIVIPQAFKAVLPSLANEFIALLKETSVAFYIGVADLTQGGIKIRSITYSNFMPLIAVAVIYLVIVVILTRLVGLLERRLRKDER